MRYINYYRNAKDGIFSSEAILYITEVEHKKIKIKNIAVYYYIFFSRRIAKENKSKYIRNK